MNSTHRVEVVPVSLEPHPNADSLSVVRVFSGYTVCARTEDWQGRLTGAYVPPDSMVDTARPEFGFLADGKRPVQRIKVKRLRGVYSMGLLVPTPDGAQIGDDVADILGVTHYEPPAPGQPGTPRGPSLEAAPAPEGVRFAYDVESLRRYGGLLTEGEEVVITEKIHGANGRWTFDGEVMHVGSRNEWKRRDESILWWKMLVAHPEIEAWCRAHPGFTLYGEVYGQVQDLKYGVTSGARVAIFDVLDDAARWLSHDEALALTTGLPMVPIVYRGGFSLDAALALAEGPSLMPGADHVREGVVVRPALERSDPRYGRTVLKVVGNGYLERA